jgi:hypothetical protein
MNSANQHSGGVLCVYGDVHASARSDLCILRMDSGTWNTIFHSHAVDSTNCNS